MKFAQREDESFVFAVDLIDENGQKVPTIESYYCSQCKRAVYLKKGKDTRPHFAHYAKTIKDHHKVNESDIHFDQKTIIHGKLKTVDIEGYIEHAVEKQVRRADIYVPEQVKVSNNLAIELQYAPISAEDVFKRQSDYQDVDCRVLWLLGYQSTYHSIFDNNHKGPTSKTLNAVRPFLRYDYEFGFYLPFWHEASGKVVLLTVNLYGQGQKQIRMSIERYINYFNDHLTYEKGDFLTSLLFGKDDPIISPAPKDLAKFIKKVLVSPTANQQKILEIIYQRQVYLQEAPADLYTYQATAMFSKVADWAIILAYVAIYQKNDPDFERTHFAQFANVLFDNQLVIEHPLFTKEIIISWLMWLFANYENS